MTTFVVELSERKKKKKKKNNEENYFFLFVDDFEFGNLKII